MPAQAISAASSSGASPRFRRHGLVLAQRFVESPA